jgi:hypothetical protein
MNAAEYADQLVFELRKIGAEVDESFRQKFLRHARRLGPDSYADLGAMIVTECFELKRDGHPLDTAAMRQVLDRIRQRLTRELKGPRWVEPLGDRPVAAPIEQQKTHREVLDALLNTLDPLDLMLVELRLEGHTSETAAKAAGLTPAAVRKRFSRILQHLHDQATKFD